MMANFLFHTKKNHFQSRKKEVSECGWFITVQSGRQISGKKLAQNQKLAQKQKLARKRRSSENQNAEGKKQTASQPSQQPASPL